MVDILRTFGALLVGGMAAAVFSGIVTAQTFSYFKNYPQDVKGIKVLVGVVWFLDFCHTIFVSIFLWDHFVAHFGLVKRIDYIPWSFSMTIVCTASLTTLVHMFFIHRIFKMSKKNYFLAVPLTIIALSRLGFAGFTTVQLIKMRSLTRFVKLYTWSVNAGLSLSALMDVLIAGLMCYLLFINHKKNSSLNHVLDKLMLYTFENGSLTSAAALTCLVCWLTNNKNLIFMGLYLIISKFYANSLLASLNTRHHLQTISCRSQYPSSGKHNFITKFSNSFQSARKGNDPLATVSSATQIQVETTQISFADTISARNIVDDSLAKKAACNSQMV